jgi:hypothetical protein
VADKKKPQRKRPTSRPATGVSPGPIVFGSVAFVVVVAVIVAILVSGGGDGGGDGGGGGGAKDDPKSLEGFVPANAYLIRCGGCHGREGEGGIGPKLADGAVREKYPNIQDQIDIVTNGKNAMPAFKDRNMTKEQIEAVVKYTRDDL